MQSLLVSLQIRSSLPKLPQVQAKLRIWTLVNGLYRMMPSDRQQKDVLIGGGGFAGLALGIALRQALGENFAVTIADPAFARGHMADTRASAIAAAARRLFQTTGVWEQVADEAQPILDMVVTDSRLEDTVRPAFLSFGGAVAKGEPFAHMIENGP